jgi:hypothetical protein
MKTGMRRGDGSGEDVAAGAKSVSVRSLPPLSPLPETNVLSVQAIVLTPSLEGLELEAGTNPADLTLADILIAKLVYDHGIPEPETGQYAITAVVLVKADDLGESSGRHYKFDPPLHLRNWVKEVDGFPLVKWLQENPTAIDRIYLTRVVPVPAQAPDSAGKKPATQAVSVTRPVAPVAAPARRTLGRTLAPATTSVEVAGIPTEAKKTLVWLVVAALTIIGTILWFWAARKKEVPATEPVARTAPARVEATPKVLAPPSVSAVTPPVAAAPVPAVSVALAPSPVVEPAPPASPPVQPETMPVRKLDGSQVSLEIGGDQLGTDNNKSALEALDEHLLAKTGYRLADFQTIDVFITYPDKIRPAKSMSALEQELGKKPRVPVTSIEFSGTLKNAPGPAK